MIKTVIIDDEEDSLNKLSKLLKEYCPQVKVLEKCRSSKAGIASIRQHEPPLLFLAIELQEMDGFELINSIREVGFNFILTTNTERHALKALHYGALDYLVKPIEPKELIAAVDKHNSREPIKNISEAETFCRKGMLRKIALPTFNGFELIEADSILRCEADDNSTIISLKNKTKILVSRSLKEVEGQLKLFDSFLRVHHSYIVNLNEVNKYVRGEGGYLVMSDGAEINVSRSRKEALLKLF